MQLTDLYPSNTPLSEVHPDFRGMKLSQWKLLKIDEMCREYYREQETWRASLTEAERDALPAPHSMKVHTHRDNYGKW